MDQYVYLEDDGHPSFIFVVNSITLVKDPCSITLVNNLILESNSGNKGISNQDVGKKINMQLSSGFQFGKL